MERTPEERQELSYVFSVTYEELRRLASTVRRGDPSATLSPTALVNEARLKLAGSSDPDSWRHSKHAPRSRCLAERHNQERVRSCFSRLSCTCRAEIYRRQRSSY